MQITFELYKPSNPKLGGFLFWGISSAVEQQTVNLLADGSNPSFPSQFFELGRYSTTVSALVFQTGDFGSNPNTCSHWGIAQRQLRLTVNQLSTSSAVRVRLPQLYCPMVQRQHKCFWCIQGWFESSSGNNNGMQRSPAYLASFGTKSTQVRILLFRQWVWWKPESM